MTTKKEELLKKAEIHTKQILPHFLSLLLQNQAKKKRAELEASNKVNELFNESNSISAFRNDEDEKEDEALESNAAHTDNERYENLKHLIPLVLKPGNEYETIEKEDISEPGKYYLKKGIHRRLAENDAGKGISEELHRRWSRTVWRQELNNLEPIYHLPTLILKRFRFVRDMEATRIGPGTYDADYYKIQQNKKNQTTRGLMEQCSQRFPKAKSDVDPLPGPGSYGNPYETYEKALDRLKHAGNLPLFQSGPCNVRTVMSVRNSYPGPASYRFKSGVEELLGKFTSKRGPYDLYTPSRDIIPFGYYKTEESNILGPGQYTIRRNLKQELNDCCNHYKGKFPEINRFRSVTGERVTLVSPLWPPEHGGSPGPAKYTKEPLNKKIGVHKHGFNRTSAARPIIKPNYDMGPDKYRPEAHRKKFGIGNGWISNFKSKSGRSDLLKIKVLEERFRGKDIPYFEKYEKEE